MTELELLQWKHLELLRKLEQLDVKATFNGEWHVDTPKLTFMGQVFERLPGDVPVLAFTRDGCNSLRVEYGPRSFRIYKPVEFNVRAG